MRAFLVLDFIKFQIITFRVLFSRLLDLYTEISSTYSPGTRPYHGGPGKLLRDLGQVFDLSSERALKCSLLRKLLSNKSKVFRNSVVGILD